MYGSALHPLHLILAIYAFGANAKSVCQAGDIGIGSSQLCQLGNAWGQDAPCGQLYQELFDDQCVSHDVSTEETYCDGGWDNGSEVQCDDDHNVTWVRRGAQWYECRSANSEAHSCTGFAWGSAQVHFCCSPWSE